MDSADGDCKRFVGCISLSRGKVPLIGLSVYDTATYVLDVYQFSDTLLFTNLNKQLATREVSIVLIPEGQAKTFREVVENHKHLCFHEVARTSYDASMGEVIVQRIKGEIFVLKFRSEERYFSLSSVAALVTYLTENANLNIKVHFSDINFLSSESKLFMPQKTVEDLELVESISKNGPTLFSLLKMTRTRMGTRLLRRNIMEPSCDLVEINSRYDFIVFLKENQGTAALIEKCLNNFVDADQLFSKISKNSGVMDKGGVVLALVELFSLIYSIRSLVEVFDTKSAFLENSLLKDLYCDLKSPEIGHIEEKLKTHIEEKFYGSRNVVSNSQYIYALKEGLNPILDISKKMYFENLEDLEKIVDESYPKEVLLHCDPKKGYVLKTKDFNIIKGITLQRAVPRRDFYKLSYDPSVLSGVLNSRESSRRAPSENTSNRVSEEESAENPKESRASDEVSSVQKESEAKKKDCDFIYLFRRNETVFFTTLESRREGLLLHHIY